jgi:hypothetical protein
LVHRDDCLGAKAPVIAVSTAYKPVVNDTRRKFTSHFNVGPFQPETRHCIYFMLTFDGVKLCKGTMSFHSNYWWRQSAQLTAIGSQSTNYCDSIADGVIRKPLKYKATQYFFHQPKCRYRPPPSHPKIGMINPSFELPERLDQVQTVAIAPRRNIAFMSHLTWTSCTSARAFIGYS